MANMFANANSLDMALSYNWNVFKNSSYELFWVFSYMPEQCFKDSEGIAESHMGRSS